MMVELSQYHADNRWGKFEFSSRANPMKLIDPTRLDLFTTIGEVFVSIRTNTVPSSYLSLQLFVGGSGGGLKITLQMGGRDNPD